MDLDNVIQQTHVKQPVTLNGINIMICIFNTILFNYCIHSNVDSIFFYRYLSKGDHVTITLWNHKKIHKSIQKPASGFLGCVRLSWNQIQRYKDTGCKYF